MELWTFYERTWQWLQEAVETSLWLNKSRYVEFIIYFTDELSHVYFSSFKKKIQKTSSNKCSLTLSSLNFVPASDSEIDKLKALKSDEKG